MLEDPPGVFAFGFLVPWGSCAGVAVALTVKGTGRAAESVGVDIFSPPQKADPHPYYARLRAEAPVHRVVLPGGQPAWLIARYDDVVSALKDDRFAKDKLNALTTGQVARQPWIPALSRPLRRNKLDLEPPDHTRVRSSVHKAFTPRLETLANGLLDNLRGRTHFDHPVGLSRIDGIVTADGLENIRAFRAAFGSKVSTVVSTDIDRPR